MTIEDALIKPVTYIDGPTVAEWVRNTTLAATGVDDVRPVTELRVERDDGEISVYVRVVNGTDDRFWLAHTPPL